MATVKERVKNAEEQTELNPTEGQKIGGNYKKGKVVIKGLKVTIENPVGSIRRGVNNKGESWENVINFSYGYFNGTIGKDGDPIDVYLGPLVDQDFQVYVIDQLDVETRSFDEHKIMFGFEDADSAKEAYLSCFNEGWKGFGHIVPMSLQKFKEWLKNKEAIKRPAHKMNKNSRVDYRNSASDERIKVIKLEGEVEEEKTLKDLQKQAGDPSKYDTLVLEIASPGGSVSEGLYIMLWLDSLSQQGKEIITVVVANAYSIASLIMLAADLRLISIHGKVMVHNPMVPELKFVNANELEKYTSELRALEQVMYELYQTFTGLGSEQIKSLMDNETYLTPEKAVELGFADLVVKVKPKPYNMADNKPKLVNMSKTLNILNKVIGMVNQTGIVNQLYYDTKGGEVEIYQTEPSTYQVGDRTNVEEGEIEIADGSTLVIKDYVIEDVKKEVEKTEEEVEAVEEVPEKVDAPVEEVVEQAAAEFNEGPAPAEVEKEAVVEAPAERPVESPVKAASEMPGKVIEKTESVKTTKETIAKDVSEEKEKPAAVEVEKEEEKPAVVETEKKEEEVVAVEEEKPDPMKEMLAILNKVSGRLDSIEKSMVEGDKKFKDLKAFEEVATEAIEAIASTSVSNFKPKARSVETPDPGRGQSIFQRALAAKRAK